MWLPIETESDNEIFHDMLRLVLPNHIITEIAVLSHEFGVVRPYRTFSVYIVTGEVELPLSSARMRVSLQCVVWYSGTTLDRERPPN